MQLNPYQPNVLTKMCPIQKENSFSDLLTLEAIYQRGNRTELSRINAKLSINRQ
jgi:hypothetical protein